MATDFSRALKLLREEKGISQRVASGGLGISQALMSHYENGTREPGLAFIARACDYYEVSADFIIGRTMVRDGSSIQPELLYDAASDRDNRLKGSAAAMLSKRLLCNSVSLLFDILGRTGHKGLISAVLRYLSAAYYKVFRLVFSSAAPKSEVFFFSVPENLYSPSCEAELARAEVQIRAILAGERRHGLPDEGIPKLPELTNETMTREYPMMVQSLLSVLHQVGEQLKNLS